MKATEFLEAQHRQLDKLFDQLEKAKDSNRKEVFDELAGLLVGHDAVEREILYPAFEKKKGMTESLGEALAEHGVVEFSLFRADTARSGKDFVACCTVLREVLEHHVKEEEKEFLPKVERALGRELSETVAARMEERFARAQEEDFRVGLEKNLRQVIDGAVKTSKRGGKGKTKKKSAAKK